MITFHAAVSKASNSIEEAHPLYASISYVVSRALQENLPVRVKEVAKRLWEASVDATLTIPNLEAELRRVSVQRGVPFDI